MLIAALLPLVIVLCVLLQFWLMTAVGMARRSSGISAPAMTGHPALERAVRVHSNTIEQLLMFLPSLWLAQSYWGALPAGCLGLIWILGRVLYALAYFKDPARRGPGFMIAILATAALLAGGSIAWLWQLLS